MTVHKHIPWANLLLFGALALLSSVLAIITLFLALDEPIAVHIVAFSTAGGFIFVFLCILEL